ALCTLAEQDPSHDCRCPPDKPVFNASRRACVEVEAKTAAVEAQPVKPAEPEPPAVSPEKKPEIVRTPPPPKPKPNAEPEKATASSKPVAQPQRVAATAKQAEIDVPAAQRRKSSNAPRLARTASLDEKEHHCRALQVWGAGLHRCVPFAIYLLGRPFAMT